MKINSQHTLEDVFSQLWLQRWTAWTHLPVNRILCWNFIATELIELEAACNYFKA